MKLTMNSIVLILLLLLPATSFGAILFEDNFDAQADWSPTQPLATEGSIECTGSCPSVPAGYDSYRLGKSYYNNVGDNTLNIDSTNYRGSSGKALTFWSEVCDSCGWASDGLLGIKLPSEGYEEIYARFYIKFQSDWKWDTSASPQQKFFRIVHYDGSGSPFVFFQEGNSRPLSTIFLAKWNGGASNTAAVVNYRYENTYYPDKANPYHVKENTYYLGTGNYAGTGEDSAMIGDGGWHYWEFYLKINSGVGVPDGKMKLWIDGELISEVNDLAWGDVGAQVSPRRLWNYVMIGGNNYNHYAPQSQAPEQWYAVDDLVISTTYIGPDYVIGGGSPPSQDTMPPAPPPSLW